MNGDWLMSFEISSRKEKPLSLSTNLKHVHAACLFGY